jgi:hypothetical protein
VRIAISVMRASIMFGFNLSGFARQKAVALSFGRRAGNAAAQDAFSSDDFSTGVESVASTQRRLA